MANESHVKKRDGSAGMGLPARPQPTPAANETHEAETGVEKFGGGYGDRLITVDQ